MASTIPPASHLGAASTHTCQLAFGSGEIKPPVRRPLDHREQNRLSGFGSVPSMKHSARRFCGTPPVWQFIGFCATSFARL
jgi:hypothetical protein